MLIPSAGLEGFDPLQLCGARCTAADGALIRGDVIGRNIDSVVVLDVLLNIDGRGVAPQFFEGEFDAFHLTGGWTLLRGHEVDPSQWVQASISLRIA